MKSEKKMKNEPFILHFLFRTHSSFRKAFLFSVSFGFAEALLPSSFFLSLPSAIRGSGFGRSSLGTSAHFGSEGEPVPCVFVFGDGWRRINIIGGTRAETWGADEPTVGGTTSTASAARTMTAPTTTASTAGGSCVAIWQLSGIECEDG